MLAVALALTLGAGIFTGLAPALLALRGDALGALRSGAREGGGRPSRLRTALTVGQATLSVVLLIIAGLFLHSLWRARSVDLGLEPARVLTVGARWPRAVDAAGPPPADSSRDRRREFYARARDHALGLPGIESAAIVVGTAFQSSFTVRLSVPGWEELPKLRGGGPYIHAISSRYFETVGLRLLRGRDFGDGDHAGSEPVAIVNRTMAATLWPRAEAIGRCLLIGPAQPAPVCARIVGVVEDAHRFALEEPPAMQYYIPLGQEQGFAGSRLLVRPRGEARQRVETLRRELRAIDPGVLWLEVRPLAASLDPQLRPWRLGATLVGTFGILALAIAVIGLYSLVGHMVASRSHELGVRIALGAGRADLLRLVLRRGLGLAGLGAAMGAALTLLAGPRLGNLLFHTSPRDPLIYAGVVGALLAAAALACVAPARRALRVDPAVALRDE